MKDRGQLQYFQREKKKNPDRPLSDEARGRLVKAIVEWTVQHSVWLSVLDHQKLFQRIQEFFPNETVSLYFINKTKSSSYSGELYNSYRGRHRKFQNETGIRKNNPAKNKADLEVGEPKDVKTITVLSTEIEVIRQRLISRAEPWEEILIDWKNTYNYRRSEIKKYSLSIALSRWPKFNHIRGGEMVIRFSVDPLFITKYLFYKKYIYDLFMLFVHRLSQILSVNMLIRKIYFLMDGENTRLA